MRVRLFILLITLTANILLAIALLRPRDSGPLPAQETTSVENASRPHRASRGSVNVTNPASAAQSPESVAANPGFNWSQLESPDYKEYIERLRAFGVGEQTIRDIIMADVQRLYRPKFAALRPAKKAANTNFWENRNGWWGPNRDMTKEQREQTTALTKEQTELIKTLLGKNVYQEMAKESGYPDWTERMFGSIPEEQRDKVSEIQERFQEAQSEIYQKAEGYIDQETQGDLKSLHRKMRDELAKILTPEQVEEYELRSSDVASNMRWELKAFEPNEQEFRAIFKYKQAQEDLSSARNSDDDTKRPTAEEKKAQQEKAKELSNTLSEALGADRAKEYKLQDDWAYRNLFEAGVAKESVFKVADMKKEAEDAARKIRQNKSLNPEERNESLKAIRTETERTLSELLGTRRAKAYSANGGWWLNNIAQKN